MLTFISLFVLLCFLTNIQAYDRRNAVLFLADDGGFEMGVYRNRICQTPNLDKLAKNSLIFNNAYTTVSSCSPSRASILTGMPSHQNGMYGLHQGIHHFNTFDNIISLPKVLNDNKIRTGLIGKKHVGPSNVFKFDYERTEENYPINQIGRNITNIKLLAREFFQTLHNNESFLLIISFHDPHRCGHVTPEYGSFCERWGSGEEGMGLIPDWKPIYYQWDEIDLPYYVQDTEPARRDIAAQYQTISRLDQGIGLIIKELENFNFINNTLIMYTSDNGPPLPSGRTNFYDPGIGEPMFISSPIHKERNNQVTYTLASTLDIFPTFLDWFNITKKNFYKNKNYQLTGISLLPLLINDNTIKRKAIFASQSYHEITMNYPMRAIRTKRYKLIHNINYNIKFPIDQDFYISPTFQDILNRTITKQKLPWYKTLNEYYNRNEWELYDLKFDPSELNNLSMNNTMKIIRKELEDELNDWLILTNDPWRCAPHSILQDKGDYINKPICMTLGHDKIDL